MKQKEISALSLRLIADFFDGSAEPLIGYLSEGVLWVGPKDNQIVRGKEELASILHHAKQHSRYTLSDISTQSAPVGKKGVNLLLFYDVIIRKPDGSTHIGRQRTLIAWELEKLSEQPDAEVGPRIVMILVSNAMAMLKTEDDLSLPDSAKSSVRAASDEDSLSRRILVRGIKDESHYLDAGSILYIESTDSSHHSLVHTTSGELPCLDRLTVLASQYSTQFLRCHASYLVNPYYVASLKRFSLTLSDGTILPVPEKKYTSFKKALNEWAVGRS